MIWNRELGGKMGIIISKKSRQIYSPEFAIVFPRPRHQTVEEPIGYQGRRISSDGQKFRRHGNPLPAFLRPMILEQQKFGNTTNRSLWLDTAFLTPDWLDYRHFQTFMRRNI